MFAPTRRRPWRHKGKLSGTIRKSTDNAPGKGTSTDQLVSAHPGLIPQLSGRLTRHRIWGACIFVDHFSDFFFLHLMQSISDEETLAAKTAYESFAATHGVTIHHYRADNGTYGDASFLNAIKDSNQTLDFCGVGGHHQNGIAESSIKRLTLATRTMLLHAKRNWPEAITTMLWCYALREAVRRHNILSANVDGQTPAALFCSTPSTFFLKDFHTWGCPCFVLDPRLQSSQIGPQKWDPRSRLGIYLGRSPFHASNVALVLNPASGHISPQYHVTFDGHFTTVPFMRSGSIPPNWKMLVDESSEYTTSEFFSESMVYSIIFNK